MSKNIKMLDIPAEIVEGILISANPVDVARFAQTCRTARSLVYGAQDQHLWRNLFLSQSFDDPRELTEPQSSPSPSPSSPAPANIQPVDWKGELQRRVWAERVVHCFDDAEPDHRKLALETLVSVVVNAVPATSNSLGQTSASLSWLSQLIQTSGILSFCPHGPERSEEERQLIARLRTYVGLSEHDHSGPHSDAMRTAARCSVYDLRNYTMQNAWGPYMPNSRGCVNWKHVEAIHAVMSMNIKDLGDEWPLSRPPMDLEATRAYSANDVSNRDPRDWAGVEGTWRRYVCFMDYRSVVF